MRTTQILSGTFATKADQKGNFTGYNTNAERIFVHKAQMEAIGIKTQDDVKPFYAIIDEREIATRDANGELTDIKVSRLQATATFKTQAELVSAVNSDAKIDIAITLDLRETATTAGLDEASIQRLLSGVI